MQWRVLIPENRVMVYNQMIEPDYSEFILTQCKLDRCLDYFNLALHKNRSALVFYIGIVHKLWEVHKTKLEIVDSKSEIGDIAVDTPGVCP